MFDPRGSRSLAIVAGVVVFFCLCFRLGYLPLLQPDEGRNAEVAREMKVSRAWLVPTYNGLNYLDKPAFYFKAVALSLAAFGDNETAARLPSAGFGLGLVVMVFAFCRRVHGPRIAWLAVIVVASMPLFLTNSRTVIFDIALAFFVCAAIFTGYCAEETEGKTRCHWYVVGAAACGFATLVKGPVGFLIPVLVLLTFNLIERRPGACRRLFAPLNVAVFCAVTLPWFIGLCLAHRDFLHYGLVEESFNRFTSSKTMRRAQPFYFYPLIVALTFFPWCLLLPEGTVATWRERWAKHRADRLCLVWYAVVLIFFSLSRSKLPGYILSATVACGILVARLFNVALADPSGRAARLVRRATVAFAVVCALLAACAAGGASHAEALAEPLRIPVEEAGHFRDWAVPLAGVLGALGGFGIVAAYRRKVGLCFLSLALFPPLLIHANGPLLHALFAAKSARPLVERLQTLPTDTAFVCFRCFPAGLPFYLGRTATLVSTDGGELTSNYILSRLAKDPHWPENILRHEQLEPWLAARQSDVFVIARRKHQATLQTLAAPRGATVELLPQDHCGVWLPAKEGR